MIRRKQMLIFWKIPVITKQCFRNIERTFHEFLFQKYFRDIPGILIGYKKSFHEVKNFKKLLSELSCEISNIGRQSPLWKCFSELYGKRFSFRVMF